MKGIGLGLGLAGGGSSYTLEGTLPGANEQDIIDGGKTLIIRLGALYTWHADVGTAGPETTALLNNLVGDGTSGTAWNDEVQPNLTAAHVTRDNDQQVTILLTAEALYKILTAERVTVTPPAAAVVGSSVDLAPRSFTIAEHPVSMAVTGTAVGATQGEIRAGGRTIVATLTNGTFDPAVGAADNPETDALLAGLSGDGEGDKAFDAEVLAKLDWNDVALSGGNTICTITLDVAAAGGYNPLGDEEITWTIPVSIVVDHGTAIEPDTFSIVEATAVLTYTPITPGESDIVAGGQQFVGTISEGILGTVAQIAAALSFQGDQSLPASWNVVGPVPAAGDITRDSDTQFTWTLPAAASYEIEQDELVTPSLAASGLEAYAGSIADPAAFTVSVVVVSMALSGTADGATQTEIRAGGRTIVATLTDGVWEPTIGQDNEYSDAVIAALSGDGTGAKRFDAELKPLLDYTMLALSGGGTILTMTLPTSGYNPLDAETITFAPTADIIAYYSASVNSDTLAITEPTASISVPFFEPTEQDIVDGGLVMVCILTDGVFGTPAQIAAALSFDGDLAEANSWDTSGPVPSAAQITRDSDTQFTWTLPAAAAYSISTDETVTPTLATSGLEAYAGALADPDPFIVGEYLGAADSWDVLVDKGGGGDATSVQAGINANPKTMWIKEDVYDEALDFDEIGIQAYFEPLTEIDDTISAGTIAASVLDVMLEFGSGCKVDGNVTLTGKGGAIVAHNGFECRVLSLIGESARIEGGGFGGTIRGGIRSLTNLYHLIEDVTVNSASAATGFDSIRCWDNADYGVCDGVKVLDADSDGIDLDVNQMLVMGVLGMDANTVMIRGWGNEIIVAALISAQAGNDIIRVMSGSINGQYLASILQRANDDAIEFVTGADDNIACSLRSDGAVKDGGAGNVVGANLETAF